MAQQKGGTYKKRDKDGLAGWFKILGTGWTGNYCWSNTLFQSECENMAGILQAISRAVTNHQDP